MVDEAHRFVLDKAIRALRRAGVESEFQGTSDLTVRDRKISGNSMRCKQKSFLYHGTVLLDLPVEWIQQCLLTPPREPEYRRHRTHEDFVGRVQQTSDLLRDAFATEWNAMERLNDWPIARVQRLAGEQYGNDQWTFRL
jgi:lipoate-protein ligase A